MLRKEDIVPILARNDKAVARALVILFNNQTNTEQNSEQTINRNGEGFRPCHARMGTSMAQFYLRKGYLTPKQVAYWRKPMACGNARIAVYWKQLAIAAEAKKATQKVMTPEVDADFGNDMEERMVLQEQIERSENKSAMLRRLHEIESRWNLELTKIGGAVYNG